VDRPGLLACPTVSRVALRAADTSVRLNYSAIMFNYSAIMFVSSERFP
jgi:hypothetical protein